MLLVNVADGSGAAFARGQAATLAMVFEQGSGDRLAVLAESQVLRGRRYGNFVLVASPAPLPLEWMPRLLAGGPHPAALVHDRELRNWIAGAPVVTDATAVPSPPPTAACSNCGPAIPRRKTGLASSVEAWLVWSALSPPSVPSRWAWAARGCSTPSPPETFTPSAINTPSASPRPPVSCRPERPTDVVTGLASPWSILRVSPKLTLVSERDSGAVERLTASGALQKIGTVPGVVHDGEGGLLGLAFLEASPGTRTSWLYAYETTACDNRIVRMSLSDTYTLGPPQVILKGLGSANHHNGGRIAFGPDGMLYATVGDAGDTSHSQDLSSLNGKILRMTPTGEVPKNNPFPGSLIWSYGHRNPQGLAWDSHGQLYAAEFGQDTWDEFNKITPGANYGWPIVEGIAHDPSSSTPWCNGRPTTPARAV